MSLSLLLASLWVVIGAGVAMMPMRYQFPPGLALLVAAPFLLAFIAWQHGGWLFLIGLLGFASMFRRPLIYLFHRLLGKTAEHPK